jgi:hypothetical protein
MQSSKYPEADACTRHHATNRSLPLVIRLLYPCAAKTHQAQLTLLTLKGAYRTGAIIQRQAESTLQTNPALKISRSPRAQFAERIRAI